jgi:DNA-binding IclR family transcriptional regulator
LPQLLSACQQVAQQGFALDDEEAEIGVGCIGVLIYDSTGRAVAGLSVSAPMERRQMAWVEEVKAVGKAISAQLGYHPPSV